MLFQVCTHVSFLWSSSLHSLLMIATSQPALTMEYCRYVYVYIFVYSTVGTQVVQCTVDFNSVRPVCMHSKSDVTLQQLSPISFAPWRHQALDMHYCLLRSGIVGMEKSQLGSSLSTMVQHIVAHGILSRKIGSCQLEGTK